MKILMMSNTYTPIVGGLEKSIQSFSEEFRQLGHEVKIVAPKFKDMLKEEEDVIRVPALQKFANTAFSVHLPLPGQLSKLMEKFKPDIVHAHHPFLVGDMALRLCGQFNLPLVFTYHTMFEQYTDYFGLDNEAMQGFVIKLATGFANMSDQVIVPSESVAEILKDRKVETPMAVVPTGVEVKRFFKENGSALRKKLKIPKNAFVVGHLGRLSPEKNLIFLAEAVAEFLKKNKKAHFLVIGSGESEKDLKQMFRLADARTRLHFGGVLKGKKVVEAYHAMDVFAFASKSETQGMVITEAMASGLPVVAIDAPGVREVVKDRLNGRLLQKESVEKFAAALKWCSGQKKASWKTLQKKAQETADKFSIEKSAQKALRVYEVTQASMDTPRDSYRKDWPDMMKRIKTEWEMLVNVGKAAGAAVVSVLTDEKSPGQEMQEQYEKKIQSLMETWSQESKKIDPAQGKKEIEEINKKKSFWESEFRKLERQASQACLLLDQQLEKAAKEMADFFKTVQVK